MTTNPKDTRAMSSPESPAPAAPGRRWRRGLRHGGRALLGLALGSGLAEAAFGYRDGWAFPHLNVYVEDEERGVRLLPGATENIRFSNNPISHVRINGEGFRGGTWPPAGDASDEVVVVGDSQVFGLGVEEGETFSEALRASLGGKAVVRNLGVPTYGPAEYNAALEEALARRPARTVVYTVNLANDLFEANRPNRERHAVWDGWAVRKETAPPRVTSFPGRSLLYTRSHAFYALRRYLYTRGPKIEEGGFASEGTWRDIGDASTAAERERLAAKEESARLARLRKIELEQAQRGAELAEQEIDERVVKVAGKRLEDTHYDYESPSWLPREGLFRASRLSPGDIVNWGGGESGRDVRVSAAQIRQGAVLRLELEKETRRRAEAERDTKTLELFAQRDELKGKVNALGSAPPPKVVPLSPLAPALQKAKAICDKHGARLLVVALPIDVQVSSSEWAKYGAKPIDMEPTKVLLEDVVVAARAAGAEGLDALPALSEAEPGAFLDGDIHMTPKGHRALGEAIARALRAPRFKPPGEGIPGSRSWPPRPSEWAPNTEIAVTESDPAGCETKLVREWLGIFCRNKGGARGVTVTSGSEVMAGIVPGEAVLIAPLVSGLDIRATFAFEGGSRELTVHVPADVQSNGTSSSVQNARIAFSKPMPPVTAGPPLPEAAPFCACLASTSDGKPCSRATAPPDVDCARTYGTDCDKLLSCASGDPAFAPRCAPGFANAGAALRCHALCAPEAPCAKGSCVDWQGGRVCM